MSTPGKDTFQVTKHLLLTVFIRRSLAQITTASGQLKIFLARADGSTREMSSSSREA